MKTRTAELAIETREPSEPDIPLRLVLDRSGKVRAGAPDLPDDRLMGLYRTMVAAHRLDQRFVQLQRKGSLPFYLSSAGHEAAGAAIAQVLTAQDWLFPGFRDLAAIVGREVPLERIADGVFGTGAASTKGRPLPVYQIHRDFNIASSSACGAAHLGHAVGAAWAAKLRKDPIVALASFSGGSVASGEFHAALNFAAVFGAPVVFLCQNQDPTPIAPLAAGYGLPGVRVDGHDVLALIATLEQAVERARGGGGSTLVEALLPLEVGSPASKHSQDGPGPETPLSLFEHYLRHRGLRPEAALDGLDAEIQAAIEQAGSNPPPDPQTLFSDVFSTQLEP